MAKEMCTITIRVTNDYDRDWGYDLEDVVKNAWGYMTPWFTRRHGVPNGKILLADEKVEISWSYTPDEDEEATDIEEA